MEKFTASMFRALRASECVIVQVGELAQLAKELVPFKQCRFIRPGVLQGSSFTHESQHPDACSIDEVFQRIEEPGS